MTGFEIFSLLNDSGIESAARTDPELMVVPKTDTLTRARSRQPVYDPVSLENESDYFMTPKFREEAATPVADVPEQEYEVIAEDRPDEEEENGD